jgi:hypothetical protein
MNDSESIKADVFIITSEFRFKIYVLKVFFTTETFYEKKSSNTKLLKNRTNDSKTEAECINYLKLEAEKGCE